MLPTLRAPGPQRIEARGGWNPSSGLVVATAPARGLGPQPSSPMRAGRTFPRWLSLCAAALVLLQLGGLVHLAVAPHGICWEHGVVVELDTAQAGVSSAGAPVGVSRASLPLVRSDEHPHCPALLLLRQARLQSPSTAPVPASSHHPLVVVGADDVPAPAGWALHRAPKQSPPV